MVNPLFVTSCCDSEIMFATKSKGAKWSLHHTADGCEIRLGTVQKPWIDDSPGNANVVSVIVSFRGANGFHAQNNCWPSLRILSYLAAWPLGAHLFGL